jgi:hypothetical protein
MKFVAGTFTIMLLSLGCRVAGDFNIYTGSPSGSILACSGSIGADVCQCLSGSGDVAVTGTSNIQTATTFTIQPGLCGKGQLDGYQTSSDPNNPNWSIFVHDNPTPSLVAGCLVQQAPITCSSSTYNQVLLCISENAPSAEVCS